MVNGGGKSYYANPTSYPNEKGQARRKQIMAVVEKEGSVTANMVAEQIEKSRSGADMMLRKMTAEGLLVVAKEGGQNYYMKAEEAPMNGQAPKKLGRPVGGGGILRKKVGQDARITQAAEILFGTQIRDVSAFLAWVDTTRELMDNG